MGPRMGRRRTERRSFCYLKALRPFCGEYGQLRFWHCPSGSVILACDECFAFFRSPESVGIGETITDPHSPDWWSAQLGYAVAGPGSGWATRSEVEATGWGHSSPAKARRATKESHAR